MSSAKPRIAAAVAGFGGCIVAIGLIRRDCDVQR